MGKNIKIFLLVLILVSFNGISFAQKDTIVFDLSKIPKESGWRIFNRKVNLVNENKGTHLHFNAQPGYGLAWHEDCNFYNGVIEVYIKGEDIQGRSFIGIAFRGVDEKTYDAVYFRPFNFISKDSVRRNHSVQYISMPVNTWEKLRKEAPGKYENDIEHALDPNSFFHAKIILDKAKVSVYVNDNPDPCLVVNELTNRTGGWVGLWVGNNSEGTFAYLKITNKQ